MLMRIFSAIVVCGLTVSVVSAQDQADRNKLKTRLATLDKQVQKLDQKKRVDAEVCAKAVRWLLKHDEFYKPNYVKSAHKTLELGLQRAALIEEGKTSWGQQPGVHALGYRSRVDDSVQPYLVTLPNGFDPSTSKRWPLYVVLHGRNKNLTESHFIGASNGNPAPTEQTWIQLEVFGRTNNAYRWAGETDVFEAMDDVIRRYRIDESRMTLWGFSMGGAGAWHLGLHHPSKWASVGAGAGFVEFYKYQKQTQQLPDYQHRTLRIYDAEDYALNLHQVPFITYGGENDSQLQTSLFMQAAAEPLNAPLQSIVGPNMGHKFDPASKAKFMEFLGKHNQRGRKRVPGDREIQFITYTLKYNRCEWLTIIEQGIPYEKTTVRSELDDQGQLVVNTENVTALSIVRSAADRVVLDGEGPFDLNLAADANLLNVYFVNDASGWQTLDYDDALAFENNPHRNKRHDLQGPIDDAFMEAFVCVRGSSPAWATELDDYANFTLNRFATEYDKWMRADVPIISDTEVDKALIESHNLVLFGDPGSNSVLKQIVPNLPLEWTKESLSFAGKNYSTKDHAATLIFPNPLNPQKYVVVNSGMTMREKDFKASNSWLFPKLGDYAVIAFERDSSGVYAETVLDAGIFDANWNK